MADYYPLIRNAIAAADEKTEGGRRVFYDRARTALVDHLRKADPPLSETIIEQERLALEEAISKVEAEAILSEGIRDSLQTQSDHPEDAAREAMVYRTVDATHLDGALRPRRRWAAVSYVSEAISRLANFVRNSSNRTLP
jgi:hypothetical protein